MQKADEQFIEGLRGLRRARDKEGGYAPHKPLLLLWALGRASRGEPRLVAFKDALPEVDKLLRDFGTASSAKRSSTEMPFWAAASDPHVWERHTSNTAVDLKADKPPKTVMEQSVSGGLPEAVHQSVQEHHEVLSTAAGELLNMLPASLGDSILERCGLDLQAKKKRDSKWSKLIVLAYEERCAICDWDLRLDGSPVGLEAAHVWEFKKGSPNTVENGVVLCSVHHQAYDRGAIAFSDQRTVLVSQYALGHHASERLLPLIDQPVRSPQGDHPPLNPAFAALHRNSQFRAPAR